MVLELIGEKNGMRLLVGAGEQVDRKKINGNKRRGGSKSFLVLKLYFDVQNQYIKKVLIFSEYKHFTFRINNLDSRNQ